MKLAIVTSHLDSIGGVEIFNRDIKKILEDKGHNVKIYGIESLKNVSKVGLEKQIGDYFNLENKKEKFDVVLCNGEFGYSIDHPKAINLFHGNYYGYAMALKDLVDSEITEDRLERAELQKISAKDKYVVTVSNSSKNQLEDFGITVDKVINNSANTNIFYPQDIKIENFAISVARGNYFEKGLDVIERLGNQKLDIRLFSDMTLEPDSIKNMGFINNEELCLEYNKAKTLLFPSRFEGGSLTTLEAMACGCPIITTPTGYGYDIQDKIQNFVAKDFGEFFTKAVLVSNERERYSKLALEYFWENHNPENFKKEWISLIEGI